MTKDGIKVLLVYANSPMDNLIPIGVSLLSSILKENGHKTKLFDTTFYNTKKETGDYVRVNTLQLKTGDLSQYGIHFKETDIIDDFRKTIEEFKPDLIGVSTVEPTLYVVRMLLTSIKDVKIPKIVGGLGVWFYDEIINEDYLDMICIGEGEGALLDLANAIRDGKDYSNIKNLWVKKDGKVIKNDIRPLIDINKLPRQDRSIFEKKRFYKPMGGKVNITAAFEIARGCPRNCSYCANYAVNKMHRSRGMNYIRKKNVDKIIDEMEKSKKELKLEYVFIYAENFLWNLRGKDFDRFVSEYKKRINLPFWVETDPESITDERFAKLEEIGCENVSTGLEHGNEEFRKKMLKRSTKNETIINAFKVVKKYKIRTSANNIIGFPEETRKLVFDTINLNRIIQPDNIIANVFAPYRGTWLRDYAIEHGYLQNVVDGGDIRSEDVILNQPSLSIEEVLGLHRTFVLYASLPKSFWPDIEKSEKFTKEGNAMHKKLSEEYWKRKDEGKLFDW